MGGHGVILARRSIPRHLRDPIAQPIQPFINKTSPGRHPGSIWSSSNRAGATTMLGFLATDPPDVLEWSLPCFCKDSLESLGFSCCYVSCTEPTVRSRLATDMAVARPSNPPWPAQNPSRPAITLSSRR
jgi:hypothetical protein